MRPGPVIVAVLSLILSIMGVVWLAQSMTRAVLSNGIEAVGPIEDEPDFPKPSETGPHPKVEFLETEHAFGTQLRFSKGSHKFVVKNNGEVDLQLKTGATTCQCTVGELGNNIVAPGESTTVELSWEIKQPGPGFHHSATIHTNDPANPLQVLDIKGFIGVDVALWPADRWSLGSVNVDGKAVMEGFIFSHIADSFDVTKVESSSPGLHFEIERLTDEQLEDLGATFTAESAPPPDPHGNDAQPETPKLKSGHRITISTDSQISAGQFSIPVTIHTTLKAAPTYSVAVTGVRPGPYQFFPLPGTLYRHGSMLIDAGLLTSSKEHTAALLVVCRGFNEELKLEEVVSDPVWLKVNLEPAPGDGDVRQYRLTLKFPAGMPPMLRTITNPATLKLRTNHPDAKILNLKAAFVVED